MKRKHIAFLSPGPIWRWCAGYRLCTSSTLEWVLGRCIGKKSKAPMIAEKFNTHGFADCKESVIELIGKVCRVSVEPLNIVKEMPL